MTRAEYLRLVAAISDRWRAGSWDDTVIETWWPQFAPHELALGVKAVKTLQDDGHGPFAPDPGLVLRHLRAASPGGARYPMGRHAGAWPELTAGRADKETASRAISACREALANARSRRDENASQASPEAP